MHRMQLSQSYQQRRRRVTRCSVAALSSLPNRCSRSQRAVPFYVVLLFTTSIALFTRTAHAYSTGAGACTGGVAPVRGFHLEPTNPDGSKRTVLSGALSEGMVSVLIDDNMNDPLVENTPYELQTQTPYTLTVVTTQDPGYKGILIRFSNNDNDVDVPNDVLLEPTDSLLQPAMACNSETNTIGLTHTTNSEKLSVTTDMTFNTPGTLILDISIVGVNDEVASLYGHTGFVLQIEGDAVTASPTGAPIVASTFPPGSTATPTVAPTISDFLIDTLSPTYKIQPPTSPTTTSNNNNVTSTSDAASPFMTPSIITAMWTVAIAVSAVNLLLL